MLAGLNEVWRAAGEHRAFAGTTAALVGSLASALAVLRQQTQIHAIERKRERRIREEMEAYACLDARLRPSQDLTALGRRVCGIVGQKSPFQRVALLARDGKGGLSIAGSFGMDEPLLRHLGVWATRIAEPVPGTGSSRARLRSIIGPSIELGNRSLAVFLTETSAAPSGTSAPDGLQQPERIIIVPFATTGDRRLLGAIVVCANHVLSIRRGLVDETLAPLETLAAKLGRALENVALAERLLRSEKLTGLGLLAGGIAHALNNPLTAVMGFAELISETAAEPRVQQDAGTIVREAQRMRSTVESLLNLWRPAIHREEAVDMAEMVRELACACEHKLAERGVRLAIEIGDDLPRVGGNPDRLRQVMEHLLNNAAQAIETYPDPSADQAHAIRVAVTSDTGTDTPSSLQIIVSDTGPGFREPGSVFDPFYTTREPGEGAGLGLSLCYSIVREHNGDITAFNLHPHGAAVMIELPINSAASTFQGPHPEAGIHQAA
jgi:signal transduction histidine kinase